MLLVILQCVTRNVSICVSQFIIFCRYSPFYYYNTQRLFREKYIGEVFLHNFSLKTVLKIL